MSVVPICTVSIMSVAEGKLPSSCTMHVYHASCDYVMRKIPSNHQILLIIRFHQRNQEIHTIIN